MRGMGSPVENEKVFNGLAPSRYRKRIAFRKYFVITLSMEIDLRLWN